MDLVCDVVVEDDALRQVARHVLVDCLALAGDDGPQVHVRGRRPWEIHSARHRSEEHSPQSALNGLLAAVNLSAVAATGTLACHAAVLTRGDTTLVLPAPSGAGKSTLTVALLQRDWAYVSDEALALDWDGNRIHPYWRPLSLSPWSVETLHVPAGVDAGGETVVPASQLGALTVEPVAPVSDVVLLDRPPQTGTPATPSSLLEPVSRQQALLALLQRGFTQHRDPATALNTLSALVGSARTWRLVVGPPGEAAALLSRTLPPASGEPAAGDLGPLSG